MRFEIACCVTPSISDISVVVAYGLSISNCRISYLNGVLGMQSEPHFLHELLSKDIMALPSASIIRKQAILDVGGFDENLVGYEDDDLYVRIFRSQWGITFLPMPTVMHRISDNSSSRSDSFLSSRLYYMQKLLKTIPDVHRFNWYFSQDSIFPRFISATLNDYMTAVAFSEFDRARVICGYMESLLHARGYVSRRQIARNKMLIKLMKNPQGFKKHVLLMTKLPHFLRKRLDRFSALKNHSAVRAEHIRIDNKTRL